MRPTDPVIHADPMALGQAVAAQIDALMCTAQDRPFLLGCPGGRSPVPVYRALAERFEARQADLSRLVIVMMDDYVLCSGAGFAHVPADAHYSCRRFALKDIRAVLQRGLPDENSIPLQNVWFPDPADPAAYEQKIEAAGGIDFFILASGASDGHVAFNPAGSARDSRTRVIALSEQTRQDNLATFPHFQDLDAVPAHGVSVGIATIAQFSKAGAMLVWGAGKREAFERLDEARTYDPQWPATVYRLIPGAQLHADRLAGGGKQ